MLPKIDFVALRDEGMSALPCDVSPEMAQDILDTWKYRGQRNTRNSRLITYQRQMLAGDWTYRTEMHVGVLPDTRTFLLNGYHRLEALTSLAGSNFTIPVLFICRLMKDEQDLANYYGVMDIGGMRSPTDAVQAQGLADAWSVPLDLLRSAGAAGSLILTDFTGGRSNSWHSAVGRSIPARIRFLREWESEIREIQGLLKPAVAAFRKIILRQPVVAVMLMTIRHQPDKAREFWSSVITGEALLLGMPAMTLRNYLLATPTAGKAEHVYARYVANCWNGYYRDKEMYRVQVISQGTSDMIVIDGTPYSRGRRERERLQRLATQRERMSQARKAKTKTPEETTSESTGEDTTVAL